MGRGGSNVTYEVSDDDHPGSAVVYIEARWGDAWYTGSGFLLGRNDVVTAAHVIFDLNLGGGADEIRVFPSYDPDDVDQAYFGVRSYSYFPDFDPDGDGRLLIGDFNRPTLSGTEKDIALLDLSEPLGDRHGWFGYTTQFVAGEVGVLGYPALYGRNLMFDSGHAEKSAIDGAYYLYPSLEVNGGNSGGPIYVTQAGDAFAVGVVSTRIGATALGAHLDWMTDEMRRNDRFIAGEAVDGWAGPDRLSGARYADRLSGFGADDVLDGGAGVDSLFGGPGSDTLTGGAHEDYLDGGGGQDWARYNGSGAGVRVDLLGGRGRPGRGGHAEGDVLARVEHLTGSAHDDRLLGSGAANRILAWSGDDRVFARGGNDRVSAGAGDDYVTGGRGDDALGGGPGADVLSGEHGDDRLWGGPGPDVFLFFAGAMRRGGHDRVMDFDGDGPDADNLMFDGALFRQLRFYETGESAMVMVRLDEGGAHSIEMMDATLADLRGQFEFV